MPRKTTTQARTGTAGTSRCITWASPPNMAPTCSRVTNTITAQPQATQPTLPSAEARAGTRPRLSRVGSPVAMV